MVIAMTPGSSRLRRFFGYPLVTILTGFVIYVGLFSIAFSVLSQLPILFLADEGLPAEGLPTEASTVLAWGVGQFISAILLAALAIWVYRRFFAGYCEGRTEVPELAMTSTAKRWLVGGVLLSAAVVALTLVAIAIGGDLTWTASVSVLGGVLAALGMATFAGVIEEFFARGLLFRVTQNHVGSLLALIITAVIFGGQHADNPGATVLSTLAVALAGGLMLASVFMLTGTLWAPIAVHFGWNLTQSLLGMPVSGNEQPGAVVAQLGGPEALTGGSFGIEVSWVALTAWALVLVVCLVAAIKRGHWVAWKAARAEVAAAA